MPILFLYAYGIMVLFNSFNFVWYTSCFFLTMTLYVYHFLVHPKVVYEGVQGDTHM